MNRAAARIVVAAVVALLGLGVVPVALAQTPPKPPAAPPATPPTTAPPTKPATPAPGTPAPKPPAKPPAKKKKPAVTRFRLVANFNAMPSSLNYDDVRTTTVYAETQTIRTSDEAGTGLGGDGALQVSLFGGLGLLAGYSYGTREVSGTADITRPHPLYLNRPRTASAELSGYGYTEGAIDVDVAYSPRAPRTSKARHLDWALFAGVTFFKVEADLLDVPTFDERYPYDQLTVLSTPGRPIKENATGWNVGGRLDYRFGKSKSFGVGLQLRYSAASVELAATDATTKSTIDAGGLSVGAGLRAYF
ncbi:MAG: hypothetical protein ACHP85_03540 [Burkholderiales bacterium]|jgi:hypothetical protein